MTDGQPVSLHLCIKKNIYICTWKPVKGFSVAFLSYLSAGIREKTVLLVKFC